MTGQILSLGDRLLLHIRGGEWHSVASLQRPLEAFVTVGQARERHEQHDGRRKVLPTDVVREGRALLIADAVADLCRQGLLATRNGQGGEEVQATPQRDQRFDVDPEFENLLPRSPEEVAALEGIILREGCRDPLIVWKQQRLLVDGYTRWRLLSLLGWTFEIKEMDFADREAVTAWMWEQHCGRRNLTPEAKSYAHGRTYNAAKQTRGGDHRAKCHSGTLLSRRAADELAKRYGIGRRTLYREARFAEALDSLVANGAPEIRHIVLSQAVCITRKQVLRLAGLPAETQRGLVAEVIMTRKPPRFPKLDETDEVRLALPLGKPRAQAKILAEKLSLDELQKLLREIKVLVRAPGAEANGVAKHRSTNGRACNRSRDGRFLERIGRDDRRPEPGRDGSLRAFPRTLAPKP